MGLADIKIVYRLTMFAVFLNDNLLTNILTIFSFMFFFEMKAFKMCFVTVHSHEN